MNNCICCGNNMENYPSQISVCNPSFSDRATQQLRKLLQERAQVILIDDLHFAQELSPIFQTSVGSINHPVQIFPLFFISSQQPINSFDHAEQVPLKLLSTQDIAEYL